MGRFIAALCGGACIVLFTIVAALYAVAGQWGYAAVYGACAAIWVYSTLTWHDLSKK